MRAPATATELRQLAAANPDLTSADHDIAEVLLASESPENASEGDLPWAQRLESKLQSWAERWKLFADREQLLDLANMTFAKYRNRALGVTSASPRPLIESTYSGNLQLLELTLRYAQHKGMRVILYLGPLRPVHPNPDSQADLARIRHDVTELAQRYGVICLDYTDLVPEAYWTRYEPVPLNQLSGDAGQFDFAHFRGEAHKMVAQQLMKEVLGGKPCASREVMRLPSLQRQVAPTKVGTRAS